MLPELSSTKTTSMGSPAFGASVAGSPAAAPGSVDAERSDGPFGVPPQQAGTAVIERMGELDLGPEELQAEAIEVLCLEERRGDPHRVKSRAVVVDQARQGGLARADAATGPVGGFEHPDRQPRFRKGDGRGQSVRPAPDDNGFGHGSSFPRCPSRQYVDAPCCRPCLTH